MNAQTLAFLEFAVSLFLVVVLKVVCFILGYLTVRLGHQSISSGAKGEFKFSARLSGTGADLASASPGLLFILLGIFLIGFAMYVDKGVVQSIKVAPSAQVPAPPVPGSNDFPKH
jgi:hypothetical protein